MNILKTYLVERQVKKMNLNINVINDNLWAVDFEYIKRGWVKEVSLKDTKASDCACLTNDGKIVLNKNHQYFNDIHRLLNIIMKFRNEQLGTDQGFRFFIRILVPNAESLTDEAFEKFINSDLLKQVQKLFNQYSGVELKRRIIHAEYIKGNKKPTGIDKIKKILKRKGVKLHGKY